MQNQVLLLLAFCLLCLAWARACTLKCGTHFELKLQLALWLPFTCFCLLLLAVSARFGLLLLAIGGCAFRSIATQVLVLESLGPPKIVFRNMDNSKLGYHGPTGPNLGALRLHLGAPGAHLGAPGDF